MILKLRNNKSERIGERPLRGYKILILALLLLLLLRLPNLFEPYWNLDEGIYLAIGQSIRNGGTLYIDAYDNKPPLVYVLATFVNGNLFFFKLLLFAWGVFLTLSFWVLSNKFWITNKWAIAVSTLLFTVFSSIPLLEGNVTNAEILFLLPNLLAFYLLYTQRDLRQIMIAGIFIGIAGLFKVPAFFEFFIWPVFWLFTKDKQLFKKILALGIGVFIPLLMCFFYFLTAGTLIEFINATFFENISYVTKWSESQNLMLFSLRFRFVVLLFLLTFLFLIREQVSRKALLISIWFLFALFAALLSSRPYTHYVIQVLPPVCISLGLVFGCKRERVFSLAIPLIFAFTFNYFAFNKYPVIDYYKNFSEWVLEKKNTSEYFAWFNGQTVENYKVAQYIKKHSFKTDEIFVYADEPFIYALTQREAASKYVVWFHIAELNRKSQALHDLTSGQPRYVVVLRDEEHLPGLSDFLDKNYLLEYKVSDTKVYELKTYARL